MELFIDPRNKKLLKDSPFAYFIDENVFESYNLHPKELRLPQTLLEQGVKMAIEQKKCYLLGKLLQYTSYKLETDVETLISNYTEDYTLKC